MSELGLSQVQAQAILDMRLHRLTGLERDKIADEKVLGMLNARLEENRMPSRLEGPSQRASMRVR